MQTNKLRPYQVEGVERLLALVETKRHAAILADEPGLGKALANGTRVATPTGFRPIEALRVGDVVFGRDGMPYSVTGVYPQGSKPCLRFQFSDGAVVVCSRDHLWQVQTRRDRKLRREGSALTAEQIASDYLTSTGRRRYYVPMAYSASYPVAFERVIPAYTMGALLANGGLSQQRVELSTNDPEVILRVDHELPPELSLHCVRKGDWAITSDFPGSPNLYRRELDRLGLRCLSVDKHIPEEYLYAADREYLLQGLMDGDGYVSREGTVQYSTSSPVLAAQVRELLESLGCLVRTSRKSAGYRSLDGEYHRCHDSYTLTINLAPGVAPFSLRRKAIRLSVQRKYYPARLVAAVEDAGCQECTCISVNSPDHLYLTEHYIPTHNTIQVAEFINRTQPKDVLIVCPASLRMNWNRELVKWVKLEARFGFYAAIRSYEDIVSGKFGLPNKRPYDLIVFDEAHYLKNPEAKRTKACLALEAKTRLFLTGTPVVNRPMDLFPILQSLGMKMSRTEFGKRYCGGKLVCVRWKPTKRYAWDFSGASNTDELNKVLRAQVMVRRTKREVLHDLPPKIRQVIELAIPDGESPELKAAVTRMFDGMEQAAANLAELKKIAFDELSNARLDLARNKLPHVEEFVRDLLAEEDKVVVFAHHREIIEALRFDLADYGTVSLYGGMTDAQKDSAVTRFQSDSNYRVFVGQIQAAGTGLTLTSAHTVVFAELDWVPGNVTQAEDRCHRIGQRDPVRVIHLVAADSIDARMVHALVEKQNVIDEVMK